MTARPLGSDEISRRQKRGVRAVLVDGFAPPVAGVKSLNCLPNVLARMDAKRAGAFEAIFVDEGGRIKEGASTNIFIVRDGTLKTPPLDEGILPGITRGAVISMAEAASIPVKTVAVTATELTLSEEAFLTNSIDEILPLVKIGGKAIGSGRPGPVTRLLQKRYGEAAYGRSG